MSMVMIIMLVVLLTVACLWGVEENMLLLS